MERHKQIGSVYTTFRRARTIFVYVVKSGFLTNLLCCSTTYVSVSYAYIMPAGRVKSYPTFAPILCLIAHSSRFEILVFTNSDHSIWGPYRILYIIDTIDSLFENFEYWPTTIGRCLECVFHSKDWMFASCSPCSLKLSRYGYFFRCPG